MSRLDETRLENAHERDGKKIARCPACFEDGHDKTGNHLSVWSSGKFACVQFPGTEGKEHRKRIFELVGVKGYETIEEAIAATQRWLKLKATRRDPYNERFVMVRFDGPQQGKKEFRPFHLSNSCWLMGDPQGKLPLFNLAQLQKRPTEKVHLVEGEKCACAFRDELGLLAITSAHGAKSVDRTDWTPLSGRKVVILPDNDDEGEGYASKAANALLNLEQPARIKIVRIPDLPPKGDCVDWLQSRNGQPQEDTIAQLRALVDAASEFVPPAESPGQNGRTPASWFREKFPGLAKEYGEAILEEKDKNDVVSVRDIGEDFFAASLGAKGNPNAPAIFLPIEERFYAYDPKAGIYQQKYEPMLLAYLSNLLLECARQCPPKSCNTKSLEFRFRDAANLSGVLRKARGILAVPPDFFATDVKFVPCANGMLQLEDNTLFPFSPSYRRRNKLAVAYDPKVSCPLFLDTLMRPALETDDLVLIQRWCGLALIGENLAQKIVILTGTPGGGKGTLIQIINGIIGQINLATLRPQLLGERFEVGRFLGKTLLYGADVPENFLNQRGASILKSLTGGDPVTLEFKNSNESPAIICRFNIIVTCNSRLTVHLEGDTDAWRRRLVIIPYTHPKPERVIVDLADQILQREASGVLNWMLKGLKKLRADGWQLHLTTNQQAAVDNLLLESDGITLFVNEALEPSKDSPLTVPDCFSAYVDFCNNRDWKTLTRRQFGNSIGDAVTRQYGLTVRHDVKTAGDGTAQRGWVGLCVHTENS